MSFGGYLSTPQLNTLAAAARDSDLIEIDRRLHLQGIFRGFASGMQRNANPLDQFQLDLNALNSVERLENGEVPLVQFLENAAAQLKLRGRAEADLFERTANLVSNRARGVKDLPNTATLPEVTRNEAIIGVDDTVDFAFLAGGTAVGKSVARVVVPRYENGNQVFGRNGAPWIMVGTGWLVSPGLLITNHHVVNARKSEEADASDADFDLQACGTTVEFDYDRQDSVPVRVKIESSVAKDKGLDYALLRLQSDPQRPSLQLRGQPVVTDATSYLPVNIIQHPRGSPKRVAFRNNLVSGADSQIVRYFTDTDFGSSGAAVCDDQWRVVALHRGATFTEGVKYKGRSTAYINFGSQISAVMNQLKQTNAAVYASILPSQPDLR